MWILSQGEEIGRLPGPEPPGVKSARAGKLGHTLGRGEPGRGVPRTRWVRVRGRKSGSTELSGTQASDAGTPWAMETTGLGTEEAEPLCRVGTDPLQARPGQARNDPEEDDGGGTQKADVRNRARMGHPQPSPVSKEHLQLVGSHLGQAPRNLWSACPHHCFWGCCLPPTSWGHGGE